MLFSSVTFLFLFLPLTVLIYYLCPKKARNAFLLLASIIFYAWGEPRYLLVMFAIILINYFGALLVSHLKQRRILLLGVTVFLNIAFLFYFKYFNFILQNLNDALKTNFSLWDIALPLGISFYTFQAISYTVDVYRKQVPAQKNLYKLALYICLFPQLIAGPIVKYHDIIDQIDNRKESFEQLYYGIRRFIIGLAKKVLIADILSVNANNIFNLGIENTTTCIAWLGTLTRAIQVYYDFSGYSDMAIGLGALFGFQFKENFNYPCLSKTMGEFWERWHISLGVWCKDYIYIPLGGSRISQLRTCVNLFILFFVIGLWHGASWNFVLFGVWNAVLIIFERIFNLKRINFNLLERIFMRIYVLLSYLIITILGNVDNLKVAYDHIKNMLGLIPHKHNNLYFSNYFDRVSVGIFVIAIIFSIPLCKNMLFWGRRNKLIGVGVDIWILLLLFLTCIQISASTYNTFIYFRF